jgi:predicted lipid-binding transport protein (Tim44 family)
MIDPSAHPDPPLGMPDPPRDLFEFWVRFMCGGLFGILMSGLLWLRMWDLGEFAWIGIPAAGLICAFAAARYGDDFWASLRFLRWW